MGLPIRPSMGVQAFCVSAMMTLQPSIDFAGQALSIGDEASANPLAIYGWSARPLLIYGPSKTNPHFEKQLTMLRQHQEGLVERDIVLIRVTGDNVETLVGEATELSAYELRRYHGVRDDVFCVVLVGKDKGVKLRQFRIVDIEDLYRLIDSMPMRRREMQEAKVDNKEE